MSNLVTSRPSLSSLPSMVLLVMRQVKYFHHEGLRVTKTFECWQNLRIFEDSNHLDCVTKSNPYKRELDRGHSTTMFFDFSTSERPLCVGFSSDLANGSVFLETVQYGPQKSSYLF